MNATPASTTSSLQSAWSRWLVVTLLVYVLLVAVGLIGDGFKLLSGGSEGAQRIFAFATNPLLGVIVGTLATALVQSSSTVTSVIVGLVAGGLPVSLAVPMIMGANMGTTITNTIVSLGSLRQQAAFRRSFEAATVHDFFNLYSILIFLPVEIAFSPLERLAGALTGTFASAGSASISEFNLLAMATDPAVDGLFGACRLLPAPFGGIVAIVLGIGLVMLSVLRLGTTLRAAMTGRAQSLFGQALGQGPLAAIGVGAIVTILVQSSSTTTSLIVPLAGAGLVTLAQVFPFTLGANIGTCVTALLAATAITGPYETFAIQIALVHLMYNVFGVALFIAVPLLRRLPILSAEALSRAAEQRKAVVFAYVLLVFFILPGLFVGGQYLLAGPRPAG